MSERHQPGHSWQEGQERDVSTSARSLQTLTAKTHRQAIAFPGLAGELQLTASQLDDNLYRLSLRIANLTEPDNLNGADRDHMLLHSMVSVHSILEATCGEFISLFDPPEPLKPAACACRNTGTWPVLAGEEGQRNLILSAPIILYDYPQIAPESPGDLFDGTEIDEILALRILTMTDAEKLEVRNCDDRARRILDRTEMLPPEHFQKLHGALRGFAK
jgi:hydrogenase maturation protease